MSQEKIKTPEETIIELETRFVYQEKTIQELSDVVFEQQKQLDLLQKNVGLLKAQLGELVDLIPQQTPGANEKPPHY